MLGNIKRHYMELLSPRLLHRLCKELYTAFYIFFCKGLNFIGKMWV